VLPARVAERVRPPGKLAEQCLGRCAGVLAVNRSALGVELLPEVREADGVAERYGVQLAEDLTELFDRGVDTHQWPGTESGHRHDVLPAPAADGELLDTSVPAVNSALQRARATLAERDITATDPYEPLDTEQQQLLDRYLRAFEHYDMDALTSVLHRDATWTMPPYELWLNTHVDIRRWCLGRGIGCRGSRLVPVRANASPAFAQYKPAADGGFDAWSLHVLEVSGGKVTIVGVRLCSHLTRRRLRNP
jgi:hypothetical protein